MKRIKKTTIDLLDDLYSLAYWMTGNECDSRELVTRTYEDVPGSTEEVVLLKAFRECYVNRFGQKADFCLHEKECKSNLQLVDSMKQWAADIKLSVLLSEISGLKHRQISEIVGRPLDTIREWLFWGRKLMVTDTLLKASA